MSEDELTRLFREKGFPPITEKTITNFLDLKAELSRVRQDGYASDDEETYPRIRRVAGPIRNHRGSGVASLSILGPTQRIASQNQTVFADLAMSAAGR
jgi:DNA-binding IclR family transcriptional regulator